MPMYFFHIERDGEVISDLEGSNLPDLESAKQEARGAAREILSQQVLNGEVYVDQAIVITRDDGIVLHTIPFGR